MRYWDSSALVPCCVRQPETDTVRALLADGSRVVTSWLSPVECWSAFARLRRQGVLDGAAEAVALSRLRVVLAGAAEVLLGPDLRRLAGRLLHDHPLRAADALQLAAALTWCGGQPEGAGFVSLDARLRAAAGAEGFRILPEEPACEPASSQAVSP